MLKECRITDENKYVKNDDIAIQITRNEQHILSPSWETINEWKRDKEADYIDFAWVRFISSFVNELNTVKAKNEINKLAKQTIELDKKGNNLYLMCYEKTNKYCHRFIIKRLIESRIKKLGGYKQKQNILEDFI